MSQSEHSTQNLKADSKVRELFFGASIVQGFNDAEGGGWVQRYRSYFESLSLANSSIDYQTVWPSLGIMGDTTKTLIKRIGPEIEARRNVHEELRVRTSVGVNNAVVDSRGNPRSTPDEYASELEELYDVIREYTDNIGTLGLTPVDESRTNPARWDPEFNLTNERIYEFDLVARGVCAARNIVFVPVFEIIMERIDAGEEMFTKKDGLHPNSKAHALMAQAAIVGFNRPVL
jgi:lysophospholipase L1-like esterase